MTPRPASRAGKPELFDLVEFSRKLAKRPQYFDLCKQITRTISTFSVAQDLDMARRCLDQLKDEKLKATGAEDSEFIIGQSLLVAAVMAYCRAVHSQTRERFPITPGGDFKKLADAHKRLVTLRDKVLAHYGRGDDIAGGPWVDDRHILRMTPAPEGHGVQVRYIFPSNRVLVRQAVLDDLTALLDAAIPAMANKLTAENNKLDEQLSRALFADAKLIDVLEHCKFDAVAYYKGDTDRAAHLLWADPRPGEKLFGFISD